MRCENDGITFRSPSNIRAKKVLQIGGYWHIHPSVNKTNWEEVQPIPARDQSATGRYFRRQLARRLRLQGLFIPMTVVSSRSRNANPR